MNTYIISQKYVFEKKTTASFFKQKHTTAYKRKTENLANNK